MALSRISPFASRKSNLPELSSGEYKFHEYLDISLSTHSDPSASRLGSECIGYLSGLAITWREATKMSCGSRFVQSSWRVHQVHRREANGYLRLGSFHLQQAASAVVDAHRLAAWQCNFQGDIFQRPHHIDIAPVPQKTVSLDARAIVHLCNKTGSSKLRV